MTTSRPYPNVIPTPTGRWEARHPLNGRTRHLGTFDSPDAAYRATLTAQADHLEAKAAEYRSRADSLRDQETTR